MELKFWQRWFTKSFGPLLTRWEWSQKEGIQRPQDYASLIARYKSWVYACASKTASTIAQTRLRLYVRGSTQRFPTRELQPEQKAYIGKLQRASEEVREILDHPLLRLLHLANPHQTGLELFELTVLFQELTGNGYWYLPSNGLGVPYEIWPLPPQYVKIVPSETNFVEGYLYGKDPTKMRAFSAKDIIHLRYPHPGNQLYGMGPLQAGLGAVDRAQAQADYKQAMWDNNARPDFMIKSQYRLGEENRERLLADFRRLHGGPKRAGKPIVLEGDMEIEELGWSPRDTAMLMEAKYDRSEICAMFGMPTTFFEVTKSRSEAEANLFAYATHTIQPRLRRLEAVINEELTPRFDKRLFVAFDNPVPENRELELDEIKAFAQYGVLTQNELRDREGYPHLDGGDELTRPATLVPANAPVPQGGGVPPARAAHPFRGQVAGGTGATVIFEAGEYLPETTARSGSEPRTAAVVQE